MSSRLDSNFQIHQLARDLGLSYSKNPSRTIIRSLEARVRRVSRRFNCESLASLLNAVAEEVGTVVREIHSDSDLTELQNEYVARGELIFANLKHDLSRPDDYGITIKLTRPEPWDRTYVSIIDCRGEKRFRSYFTAWHELAHLLTLTPQTRFVFRRSHSRECAGDPEEKLMDAIAGAFGFFRDLLPCDTTEEISFEGIAAIRSEFCPTASVAASSIGIVRAYPTPCILVRAELGYNKEEVALLKQARFDFATSAPVPSLRAVHSTVNDAARESDIQFHRNWKVPRRSVIAEVFASGTYAEAVEDLSWWQTSSGKKLSAMTVRVKAQKLGAGVQALIIPVER